MKRVYGIDVETNADNLSEGRFDVVVLAVAHRQFLHMFAGIYSVKSVLPVSWVDGRLWKEIIGSGRKNDREI